MKFSQFRDVVAVADCGSLRAAARHLDITQPTISRSIQDIERELGIVLFERHARGVMVTEMGRAFVQRAKAVITEIRRAREEIDQLKGRTTGEINVAVSTTAVVALMPTAVARLHQRYPDILVHLSERFFEPVATEVRSGQIDFYVGPVDPKSVARDFLVEKLFDNQRYIFARKGHPLAQAKSLADLSGAKWLKPTQSRQGVDDFAGIFLRQGLPAPHETIHAHSILSTLLMVAQTDLLTQLPSVWRDYAPVGDYLTALDGIGPLDALPICIVRRHDLPLTPLAEHLSDLVRRVAGTYARRIAQEGGAA